MIQYIIPLIIVASIITYVQFKHRTKDGNTAGTSIQVPDIGLPIPDQYQRDSQLGELGKIMCVPVSWGNLLDYYGYGPYTGVTQIFMLAEEMETGTSEYPYGTNKDKSVDGVNRYLYDPIGDGPGLTHLAEGIHSPNIKQIMAYAPLVMHMDMIKNGEKVYGHAVVLEGVSVDDSIMLINNPETPQEVTETHLYKVHDGVGAVMVYGPWPNAIEYGVVTFIGYIVK